MINSRELPTNTCYLEYPDGSIKLMTAKRNARNFMLIRILSEAENKQIREKFGLAIIVVADVICGSQNSQIPTRL